MVAPVNIGRETRRGTSLLFFSIEYLIMGLFEDFSRFLETRLEEFLKDNPHLELQALEEQLREQEEDTLRLIADLSREEKKLQAEILAVAQDVQKWHQWVQKAQAANRFRFSRGGSRTGGGIFASRESTLGTNAGSKRTDSKI